MPEAQSDPGPVTPALQLVNIVMRTIPLGAKYVFALLLVRMYPLGDVGLYNNATGYVSVVGLLIGLQYFYFVNRQLPRSDALTRRRLLVTQLSFDIVVYAVALLPLLMAFRNMHGIGPVVVGLIFVSHLNLEAYRALYALGRPILASTVFGIGNGLWGIPVGLFVVLAAQPPKIDAILLAVAVFNGVSALLGVYVIHRQTYVGGRVAPDVGMVLKGLRTTVPITTSVVAQRASELLGRFLLEFSAGLAAVGLFSSFQVLASSILIVVESGVVAIALPHLVKSRAASATEYRLRRRATLLQTALVVTAGSVLMAVVAHPLFSLLGQDALEKHMRVFYIMVVSYAALGLSSYFGLVMYVEHMDRALVQLTLSLAVGNAIALVVALFVFRGGPLSAAVVLAFWSVFQLIGKWYISGVPRRRETVLDSVP